MGLKFTIFAREESQRQHLESVLAATGRATMAGRPLPVPLPFQGNDPVLRQVQQQTPEAVLIELPAGSPEAAFPLISWLRGQLQLAAVMVVGPMEPSAVIVGAMRAGATEYLESPLRSAAIDEALTRCSASRGPEQRPVSRGKLIAVLGARGGCGATTVSVNLALALHALRRQADGPVVLVDAAPLGHAALHLNLKPQFTLSDLLSHASRLDAAMLTSLMLKHETGLELLAGPYQPLAALPDALHAAWLELVLQTYPLVVADLSARLDGLTAAIMEQADRILFVTQTDMVSLWSAAKVRQYLDPQVRLRFALVLNRFTATPDVDLASLESITKTPVLWKLPNAHAQVVDAIERGQPPATKQDSDLAKSYYDLAAHLLGRPPKKHKSWIPFLRVREVPS
ncbi:MAG TPA: AAA family ATPase [Terriglobales bacterium]|nr:AAA family ATPase [Terriglobales bacterium]